MSVPKKPASKSKAPILQLIESALEFIKRGADELEKQPKYSIINFATGIELMLKARLVKEHWSLVVEKSGDAILKDFQEGKTKTVTPREAMKRLRNVCNDPVPEDAQKAFEAIAEHRNRVMHFFHEVASGAAAPALLETVTREQCHCWYFLERMIRGWGAPFTDDVSTLWQIGNRMKQNRKYLETVYSREKPEIDKLKASKAVFATCGGCGFEASRVTQLDDNVDEQHCRVCGVMEQYVTIDCPTSSCDASVRMLAEHGSDRACLACGYEVTSDDISNALDTSTFDDTLSSPGVSCASCTGYHTGIEHNELYICSECLISDGNVQYCEWCGDGQIGGGSLEDSYYMGCEFCEGQSGSIKDD
jgi:hypothetical protein